MFFYGNPVPYDKFKGRKREIEQIVSRILSQGQSTAIVGEPRIGKTSLLNYISTPEIFDRLYGPSNVHILFSYLDAHTFNNKLTQAQFWELALRPLVETTLILPNPSSLLHQVYENCIANNYKTFALEQLINQMALRGLRLVLMIDEFDSLMNHDNLFTNEFFGSLRSLASRSRGSLVIIIASRQTTTELIKATQMLSRRSSPYFNIFREIVLGPLSNQDVAEVLISAEKFSKEDRQFISRITGGHPYLVQLAASTLWESYQDNSISNPILRRQQAGQALYNQVDQMMKDSWHSWSDAKRKAFAIVALNHIYHLMDAEKFLAMRKFHLKNISSESASLRLELKLLQQQGYIKRNEKVTTNKWVVQAIAYLWWVADEILRTKRNETSFSDWLLSEEKDGMLTRGKKEQIKKIILAIGETLKDGVSTLIEAAAKGAGENIVK